MRGGGQTLWCGRVHFQDSFPTGDGWKPGGHLAKVPTHAPSGRVTSRQQDFFHRGRWSNERDRSCMASCDLASEVTRCHLQCPPLVGGIKSPSDLDTDSMKRMSKGLVAVFRATAPLWGHYIIRVEDSRFRVSKTRI